MNGPIGHFRIREDAIVIVVDVSIVGDFVLVRVRQVRRRANHPHARRDRRAVGIEGVVDAVSVLVAVRGRRSCEVSRSVQIRVVPLGVIGHAIVVGIHLEIVGDGVLVTVEAHRRTHLAAFRGIGNTVSVGVQVTIVHHSVQVGILGRSRRADDGLARARLGAIRVERVVDAVSVGVDVDRRDVGHAVHVSVVPLDGVTDGVAVGVERQMVGGIDAIGIRW